MVAAIDLTHLVHETYQTNAADAWWYNGFCALSVNSSLSISNTDHTRPRRVYRCNSSTHVILSPINAGAIYHGETSKCLEGGNDSVRVDGSITPLR